MALPFLQQFVDTEQDAEFTDAPYVHVPPALPPEPTVTADTIPPAEAAPTIIAALTPRNLVSALFSARDKAHQLHLRTKSFSVHMALGDFYEELLTFADEIAEAMQGKYGIMEPVVSTPTPGDDAVAFIHELAAWAETAHSYIPAGDTFLSNMVDEVQALIYRTKYKIDNLH